TVLRVGTERMTVLSGQTIRELGIFSPHCERTRHEESGLTYGLSAAGYDVRIRVDLVLAPQHRLDPRVGRSFALAVTVEHFDMPSMVLGRVCDKSTLARMGLQVFNTVIEPGWRGYLTLELANHSSETIRLLAGQPIAQVILELLDQPAEQ